MLTNLLDSLLPDQDDEHVNVWVGIIALLLLGYLVAIKRGFGARAI